VRIHTLGTGTLHPVAGRASAGLALEVAGEILGFDIGRGVLNRYTEAGLDPLQLQYLHLSHLHPDHCCDLVPLLFALRYAPEPPRSKPLHITAPEGLSNLLENLRRAWKWIEPEYPLHLREAEESSFEEAGATITTCFLDHGKMANLGYRVEAEGKSLVYTGDTERGEGLLNLAKGVNILISECSFTDAKAQANHMAPSRLGQIARAAEVEKLVITHLYPSTDASEVKREVAHHYDGEVVIAEDKMILEL
jgi:ribonuclease BN (tRNA processing enzyme)